jgi:hypothetical protein
MGHARTYRRRNLEAQDECWHVYYGNVRVGTIAKRVGISVQRRSVGLGLRFLSGLPSARADQRCGTDLRPVAR